VGQHNEQRASEGRLGRRDGKYKGDKKKILRRRTM
jgi:hypothetical protein